MGSGLPQANDGNLGPASRGLPSVCPTPSAAPALPSCPQVCLCSPDRWAPSLPVPAHTFWIRGSPPTLFPALGHPTKV
eukprot:2997338-Heterocapsa_arctica.AAC.1